MIAKALLFCVCVVATGAVQASELAPFDRLGKGNVSVRVRAVSGDTQVEKKRVSATQVSIGGSFSKTFEVELSPIADSSPVVIELYALGQRSGYEPLARPIGIREASSGSGKFTFLLDSATFNGLMMADDIKGWVARVVRDGRVVGAAGSTPALEALAKDPVAFAPMLGAPRKK